MVIVLRLYRHRHRQCCDVASFTFFSSSDYAKIDQLAKRNEILGVIQLHTHGAKAYFMSRFIGVSVTVWYGMRHGMHRSTRNNNRVYQ